MIFRFVLQQHKSHHKLHFDRLSKLNRVLQDISGISVNLILVEIDFIITSQLKSA
jgi:hypothetical protein